MDDDENDLDNIFEEYETDDVRPEENAGTNEGAANDTLTAERVPVPKRIVKNPRLKFNAERLCGERGIPVLVNHFKDVKFKGKGHEIEDLNKLMSTLEHWCHRLYPSMKFEDCLRQIEKLGKKRPVQTCLRKIRMDMPILNSDFVHDEDDERSEEVQTELEVPPQDAFDRLISETQEASSAHLISTPLPLKSSTVGHTLGTFGSTLTEEQRKRMEYNKKLAAERRKSKLISTHSSSADTVSRSHELFTATETSTLGAETSNFMENNPTNEDTIEESISLLAPHTSESLLTSTVEDDSEELELDDLVDLVDDEDCQPIRTGSGKHKSKTSHSIDYQDNTTVELVDLSEVDNESFRSKRCIQVIDVENVNTNSLSNQQIEVIHLDNEVVNEEFKSKDYSDVHARIENVDLINVSDTELSGGEESLMLSARTDVTSSNKNADFPTKLVELREESDSFAMDTDETQVLQNTCEIQEPMDNLVQLMDVELPNANI